MPFVYHLPTRIVFGRPAHEAVVGALESLRVRDLLLVSDPGLTALGLVESLQTALARRGCSVTCYTDVSSNPTVDEVERALASARETDVKAVVALGGGSPIDVAKAVAMLMTNGGRYDEYQWSGKQIGRPSLPLIAVPTTAGTGSEVSKVAVIVDPHHPFKKGVVSPHLYPATAVLDPDLTRTLPPDLTAATGIDAFTHALEAYIGRAANPHTDVLALAAMESIWWALPRAVEDGSDMTARRALMLAAMWAGTAMDHAGLGLIHSLSGPLTGLFHLHHGLANALLLPTVFQFNLPSISPQRLDRLQQIMGLEGTAGRQEVASSLREFVARLGLPTVLASVVDITPLTRPAVQNQVISDTLRMAMTPNNPRPVGEEDVRRILTALIEQE
ncbi:MAG: iron-containing alcohol dehydrogenase [Chloroflexi bacterium]|nr:MAG: iron-containing alcohol dehydrogenase [Chloroflexota bacterium]